MTRRLLSTGSPFERNFGYSRAVIDGDLVFVSGTTGYDYATMANQHFHLFETTIGPCAVVWEGERFIGAQLPERDEAAARKRLERRFPEADETEAEGFVAEAVTGIRALFDGEKRDLSHLPMALESVSEFNRKVYEVALVIPHDAGVGMGHRLSSSPAGLEPQPRSVRYAGVTPKQGSPGSGAREPKGSPVAQPALPYRIGYDRR